MPGACTRMTSSMFRLAHVLATLLWCPPVHLCPPLSIPAPCVQAAVLFGVQKAINALWRAHASKVEVIPNGRHKLAARHCASCPPW